MKFFELKKFRERAEKAGLVDAVEKGVGPSPEKVRTEAGAKPSKDNSVSYAAFSAMTPAQKAAHFRAGGKLANVPLPPQRAEVGEIVPEKPKKVMTLTEFRKLPQSEKARWCLSGGKLSNE